MQDYEPIIGLEVHIELKTGRKLFCGCLAEFGAAPNSLICPVCAGMPGALPVLNEEAAECAVLAGLALDCEIAEFSAFDRKHYFYPDLPKGYQITQYEIPLCKNGGLEIETPAGPKRVRIAQIHMEEDAGKLIHSGGRTLLDCNRCGLPLIEIVTEPEIKSAAEALAFLKTLRETMRFLRVSDARMNEGAMRADVNISVRKKGENALGERVEIKNMNSFAFAGKAIEYEFARQAAELEAGREIRRETRGFDEVTGKTYPMREKEEAGDYRYFPDPDLPPLRVDPAQTERLHAALPPLPVRRRREYFEKYGIPLSDGAILTSGRAAADWFEAAAELTKYPKRLADLIISEILKLLPDDPEIIPLSPSSMAVLSDLLGDGAISAFTARALARELFQRDFDPKRAVADRGLAVIRGEAELLSIALSAIAENPGAAADWRNGKAAAVSRIVGAAMKKAGGRADAARLREIIKKELL